MCRQDCSRWQLVLAFYWFPLALQLQGFLVPYQHRHTFRRSRQQHYIVHMQKILAIIYTSSQLLFYMVYIYNFCCVYVKKYNSKCILILCCWTFLYYYHTSLVKPFYFAFSFPLFPSTQLSNTTGFLFWLSHLCYLSIYFYKSFISLSFSCISCCTFLEREIYLCLFDFIPKSSDLFIHLSCFSPSSTLRSTCWSIVSLCIAERWWRL